MQLHIESIPFRLLHQHTLQEVYQIQRIPLHKGNKIDIVQNLRAFPKRNITGLIVPGSTLLILYLSRQCPKI